MIHMFFYSFLFLMLALYLGRMSGVEIESIALNCEVKHP